MLVISSYIIYHIWPGAEGGVLGSAWQILLGAWDHHNTHQQASVLIFQYVYFEGQSFELKMFFGRPVFWFSNMFVLQASILIFQYSNIYFKGQYFDFEMFFGSQSFDFPICLFWGPVFWFSNIYFEGQYFDLMFTLNFDDFRPEKFLWVYYVPAALFTITSWYSYLFKVSNTDLTTL